MRGDYLDRYAAMHSPIHVLEPRLKVICFGLLVVLIALTPAASAAAYFLIVVLLYSLVFLSDIPAGFVMKRSLIILPFILAIALFNIFTGPPEIFLSIIARAWLSVTALIILTATTPFASILKALESLRVPRLLTTVISFTYRYIFVLLDSAGKLERARLARGYGRRGIRQMRAAGNILGSLFVNTYERGERIFQAMLSRGYHGHAHSSRRFRLKPFDLIFTAYFVLAMALIGWVAYA